MRILIALAAVLLCSVAQAQVVVDGRGTIDISWTNATQYEDGSPLDPSDIESVTIFYGPTSKDGRDCPYPVSASDATCYPLATEVTADGATSTGITLALTQTTTFYFAGVTKAGGQFSAYSAEAPVTFTLEIDNLKPNAPSGVEVDVQITCTTDTAGVTCRFVVT